MTDVEFVAKRYKPCRATSLLRVFRVFFDGIVINCIVMASVTLAMAKTIRSLLVLPEGVVLDIGFIGALDAPDLLLIALAAVALFYSALSGLYGVVYTDLMQFALAMAGSIGLAVIVYRDACTGGGLTEKLANTPALREHGLGFFPDLSTLDLKSFTFFVYISVIWWARAPGNGYYVQRLLATRSERDSFLAFLWFNVCQYIIRPWPWILVGLISLHYLPGLKDHESSFPMMMNLFLPAGLKGVMAASMLAAFMSTIDTHLNWSASYVINDFYHPFINRNAGQRHYVMVSRLTMLALTMIALLIANRLTTIIGAYKYLAVTFAGIGTVMICRWYWWRVNAYSEIAAIVASLVLANYLQVKLPSTPSTDLFAIRIVITIIAVTGTWVAVTFLTSGNVPDKHTVAFYTKMKIPGPGWKKVRQVAQIKQEGGELGRSALAWVTCVLCILSTTLGIGKLLFQQWRTALVYLCVAAAAGCALKTFISKMSFLKTPPQ